MRERGKRATLRHRFIDVVLCKSAHEYIKLGIEIKISTYTRVSDLDYHYVQSLLRRIITF